MSELELRPGRLAEAVAARLAGWHEAGLGRAMASLDPTPWGGPDVPEVADRLGWVVLPRAMEGAVATLRQLGQGARDAGTRHLLLLGMGGSSLAPEVFQAVLGNRPGWPRLTVLDSTHPDAIEAALAPLDLQRTVVVVSSKSGTTVETSSLLEHVLARAGADDPEAPRRFIAITDPATPLERLGVERSFGHVVLAPPDVGGRFSALSVFGLVPAALLGVDLEQLLRRAQPAADELAAGGGRGLELGAFLLEAARAGRPLLTLLTSPGLAALPAWLEQLIAESTGKAGAGIVPVADEPPRAPAAYGPDRVFVGLVLGSDAALEERLQALAAAGHPVAVIRLDDAAELGGEMYRWEVATAAVGAGLGVNPFDQPDVQLAKELARKAMRGEQLGAEQAPRAAVQDPDLGRALATWLAHAGAGRYLGLQAFLAPTGATPELLARLRAELGQRTGLATTLGVGPRFLHSTGQLHKGGPDGGLFLQLTDQPAADLPIPGSDATFARLVRAQADGDLAALAARGRRVLRVELGADAAAGLARLLEAARGA